MATTHLKDTSTTVDIICQRVTSYRYLQILTGGRPQNDVKCNAETIFRSMQFVSDKPLICRSPPKQISLDASPVHATNCQVSIISAVRIGTIFGFQKAIVLWSMHEACGHACNCLGRTYGQPSLAGLIRYDILFVGICRRVAGEGISRITNIRESSSNPGVGSVSQNTK